MLPCGALCRPGLGRVAPTSAVGEISWPGREAGGSQVAFSLRAHTPAALARSTAYHPISTAMTACCSQFVQLTTSSGSSQKARRARWWRSKAKNMPRYIPWGIETGALGIAALGMPGVAIISPDQAKDSS